MTLDAWLRDHSEQRAVAGLARRLTAEPVDAALIDLAGNDYLGLRRDGRVTEAAATAARVWGAGAGASRLVTGTLQLHAELEAELATFTGHAAALTFSTGYAANLGAVTALTDPDTLIVSDAHVHASLVDACRLARPGQLVITRHNDAAAVATALRTRRLPRALVLVESVYSVDGDAAPLAELASATAEHDAVLLVDEAHAFGVAGEGGRGLVNWHGLSTRADVVTTATLSKALGSQGGVVLGSEALVEHLINAARQFIYDTGLAPPVTAAALAALRVIDAEPGLPHRAAANAAAMSAPSKLQPPAAAVFSLPMPGPLEALAAQAELAGHGFRVGCFRPPSVPDGVSRLRLTGRATLTDEVVEQVGELLSTVRRA